jgi:hypothetical protein
LSDIGSLVAELIDAGCAPDVAAAVVARAFVSGVESSEFRGIPVDRTAEKRRAYDRERKRKSTGIPPETTGTPKAPPIVLDNKKEKKDRGSQLPDGWRPDEIRWDAVCRKIGTTAAETELNKFTSHHRAKGTVFKNWSFGWDKWLLQSEQWRPKTTATTEMPSFSAPADIDWKHVLSFYKKTGNWSKWAGPDPDSAACRAPPDLLREFGLERTA